MKRFQSIKLSLPLLLGSLLLALTSCANPPPAPVQPNAVETDSAKKWAGKTAKGFSLPGIDGATVDVGADLGKRPVVLVFYRGVW